MQAELRAAISRLVLADIPKLLTLLDRTPVSPTYGCFDRAYWHYRMIDFPCGMGQEFVLPLALVWSMPDLPGNVYYQDPLIREFVIAGIRYAARSAHPDGSCDDYYPFERAAGAAAFSLFAILESLDIVGISADAEIDAFVQRRANWLASHTESGRLSNHEALIISCLERARIRYPNQKFDAQIDTRLRRLLSWQSSEGWFDEYGGADLGYLSLTIGLLSDLDRRRPDLELRKPLTAAIDFFANFVHPDGTVGGEYANRGTLNFFPFGFEIAGGWYEDALRINNLALKPIIEARTPCYSDDRILAHHLWGWLFTLREYQEKRPVNVLTPADSTWFPGCGLMVERKGQDMLVASLHKGGVYKFFSDERLVASDTGVTLRTQGGRVAVTHLGGSTVERAGDTITVSGQMGWAKSTRLTPVKNVILRCLMISLGRFFPDLVRRLLQKILVTGKSPAPYNYRRQFVKTTGGWIVTDQITADKDWKDAAQIGISSHQTSTTTVMARVFQQSQQTAFIEIAIPGDGQNASFERRLESLDA
ncbi:hypothetical protein [Phyllobacterium sp. YR531]|uniref:hypothetical protein n=1 Tax=Phyllobacterium sp. YR531 TaxID=1144343 RepID=UPI00026FB299|nr:hypothetical protein [Phyllobacterium sp. YR531]EJN00615.1 hypothetical protein PMI41_03638 [Phyllobacterium sp. YR531]